jgi:hypothetical protein
MANQQPTEWARKYGRRNPTDIHSGLSPIYPNLLDGASLIHGTGRRPVQELLDEQFQRTRFDFTTQELVDIGCITSQPFKPGNLNNQLLPFLRQERWDDGTHLYQFPAPGGGIWTAHNPQVWAVLEPVLRLASRIFGDLMMTPFVSVFLSC